MPDPDIHPGSPKGIETTAYNTGWSSVTPVTALQRLRSSWVVFKWAALTVACILLGATWLEVTHLQAGLKDALIRGEIAERAAANLSTALWWLKGVIVTMMLIQLSALLLFCKIVVNPAIQDAISVTKEADARKEELKRLAMVVERTVNGFVITDTKARIQWINRGFTRISGYTLEELKGKDPGEILRSENSDPKVLKRMSQAVKNGQGFHELLLNRTKDGRDYWVEIEAQPLYDALGRLTGFMAIETDVSERHQLEQQLRRSEERLRLATDAADIGVWEYECDTGDMRWSETLHRVLGLAPGSCKPSWELWSSLLHPDDANNTLSEMNETLEQGRDWRSVVKMNIKGSTRYILTVAKVIEFRNGKPHRKTGISLDVTSEYNRRAEAERQLAILERLGETARIGAWELELPTMLLTWSPEVRRLHEVSDHYVPDLTTAINFYPNEARDTISNAVQAAINHGEPYDLELPFITAKGRSMWIRATGRPERNAAGVVERIWGVFQDISELKQAALMQEHARHTAEIASQQKSLFLANMSHEIRTPLVSILGYTELLADNLANTDEECTQNIEVIRRNGEHLAALVNDILDYSKIDVAGVTLHPEDCSPSQILRDVVAMLRQRALYKKIQLSVSIDDDIPPTANLDPLRLRQILVNLTGNAVKFTETGSVSLRVSTFEPQPNAHGRQATEYAHRQAQAPTLGLRFIVEDTGPGIESKTLATLFEPFTQGDPTYTRQHGGTGLGLVISRRLARAMGGDILYDQSYKEGSRFVVTLVAARTTENKQADNVAIERTADPAGQTAASQTNDHVATITDDSAPTTATTADTPQITNSSEVRSHHAAPIADERPLQGKRVLIAEDSPDSMRLFIAFLDKAGADLTIVNNGADAVNAVARANLDSMPFDIVLMDVQMPVLDGHEATRQIRINDTATPIIALTAHASPDDVERSKEAGCNAHLTKPIKREKLIESCVYWSSAAAKSSNNTKAAA